MNIYQELEQFIKEHGLNVPVTDDLIRLIDLKTCPIQSRLNIAIREIKEHCSGEFKDSVLPQIDKEPIHKGFMNDTFEDMIKHYNSNL